MKVIRPLHEVVVDKSLAFQLRRLKKVRVPDAVQPVAVDRGSEAASDTEDGPAKTVPEDGATRNGTAVAATVAGFPTHSEVLDTLARKHAALVWAADTVLTGQASTEVSEAVDTSVVDDTSHTEADGSPEQSSPEGLDSSTALSTPDSQLSKTSAGESGTSAKDEDPVRSKPAGSSPVSYTHLTLPTKRIV